MTKRDPPPKPIIIPCDLWKFNVHLLVPCTQDQEMRYARRISPDIEKEKSEEWCAASSRTVLFSSVHIVALREFNKNCEDDVAILSHELLHCTNESLNTRGLTLTEASEEAFTYTHEYLLTTALKLLKKK